MRGHAERLSVYLLALVAPLSLSWPVGFTNMSYPLTFFMRPAIAASDLAVGALLLTWPSANTPALRRSGLLTLAAPLVVIVALALLSIPGSLLPGAAAYATLRWLLALLVCLRVAASTAQRDRLIAVFLIGLGVQAAIGIGQVWRQGPLGFPGEMALPAWQSGASYVPIAGVRWLRAYGLTTHPNVLGGFLSCGLILGLSGATTWPRRMLWWLLWAGLALSFSRSAWLATAFVLPLASTWLVRQRAATRHHVLLTVGCPLAITLIAVAVFPAAVQGRLLLTGEPAEVRSVSERAVLMQLAARSILEHPLWGMGAGSFPLLTLREGLLLSPQPVHNVTLLLAAEIGVAGGLAWLWLWLAPGVRLWRRWRSMSEPGVILTCAWLGLGTVSLFDHYPWALNSGRLLVAFLLGLLGREMLREMRETVPAAPSCPAGESAP